MLIEVILKFKTCFIVRVRSTANIVFGATVTTSVVTVVVTTVTTPVVTVVVTTVTTPVVTVVVTTVTTLGRLSPMTHFFPKTHLLQLSLYVCA